MTNLLWNNARCEPVIITYNRAHQLDVTLAAFFELQRYNINVHVLDNCSTDTTSAIVEKWQSNWPQLIYHRNLYNIGGNANLLRALELTTSDYSWVIGDDDAWHLEHINELIQALNSDQADIIRLGWLVSEKYAGQYTNAQKLVDEERFFFASLSMISATIIRRHLMTANLPQAYSNIGNVYPQLVPCIKAFENKPLTIYSLKKPLLTHTPSIEPGYFLGDLEWYVAWFNTSRFFSSKLLKKKFSAEVVRYMIRPQRGTFREFIWLLKVTLNAKANRVPQGTYLAELFLVGYGWRLRLACLSLVYMLFPCSLARCVRYIHFYLKKKPLTTLTCDRSRL